MWRPPIARRQRRYDRGEEGCRQATYPSALNVTRHGSSGADPHRQGGVYELVTLCHQRPRSWRDQVAPTEAAHDAPLRSLEITITMRHDGG